MSDTTNKISSPAPVLSPSHLHSHSHSLSHSHSHSQANHHRSLSRDRDSATPSSPPPRSPSPPSQTYHPPALHIPTPALVESVAGGAHYSGIRMDPEGLLKHRRSSGMDPDRRDESHLEVQGEHTKALEDLKELFGCRPKREIFERGWSKEAVFEDPLSKCKGFGEYAPQWFAMPKIFRKSEQLSSRVMSSTRSPNRLVYTQKQEYTFRLFGNKKVVESIVTVDFDENDKIIRLADQWDGKEAPTRFGIYYLRRLNAKVVPWLVHVPKH